MSRKPCVVMSAQGAPVRSRMVLIATVVPCRNSRAERKLAPALRHAVLDAGDESRRRGERLSELELAGRLVEGGDIGEGAADVGRQPDSTRFHRAQKKNSGEIRRGASDDINAHHASGNAGHVFARARDVPRAAATGITSLANRPIDRRHFLARQIAERELPDHVVATGLRRAGRRGIRPPSPASRRCPGRARPPGRRSRGGDATAGGHAAGTDSVKLACQTR